MAILEDLGIEVTVEVRGEKAVEYKHERSSPIASGSEDDVPTTESYIESLDDAEFAIEIYDIFKDPWIHEAKRRCHIFEIFIDGQKAKGEIVYPHGKSSCQRLISGKKEYDSDSRMASFRAFKFAAVKSVEDVDSVRVEQDKIKVKSLALIEVRVQQATAEGRRYVPKTLGIGRSTPDEPLAVKALSESLVTHGLSYAAEGVPMEKPTHRKSRDERLIAVFRFRYGSKDALKQHRIIPGTPKPSPEPSPEPSRRFEDLTIGELQRLARERFNQLEPESKSVTTQGQGRVKRESAETSLDVADRRPVKVAKRTKEKVTVDLTDD